MLMHFLCLLRCRCFTCTNSPNRFICYDNTSYFLSIQMKQRFLQLFLYIIILFILFTDRKGFAATEYGGYIILQTNIEFVSQGFTCFKEILSSFTMANYGIFNP